MILKVEICGAGTIQERDCGARFACCTRVRCWWVTVVVVASAAGTTVVEEVTVAAERTAADEETAVR